MTLFRQKLHQKIPAGFSILLVVFLILPIIYLVIRALGAPVRDIYQFLFSPRTAKVITNSLGLTLGVTVISSFIAVPAAFLTVRTDLKFSRFWQIILILPLVIPSYVGAFAFIAFAGPRGSILHNWLSPLGIERLPSIYGWPGALVVLSLFTYPYLYLTVSSALQGLNPHLEEAGRSLGENSRGVFRRIILPRLLPALGAGGLLVGLYTLSDFGAVSLLQFDSFTRMIYVEYNFSFDPHSAAFYALILIIISIFLLAGEFILKKLSAYKITADPDKKMLASPIKLGGWQFFAQFFLFLVAAGGVLLPVGVSMYWVFRGLMAGGGIEISTSALYNSLAVSGATALIALVAALPVSIYALTKSKLSLVIEKATYLGYALPGIVVGLGLIFFSISFTPRLYQSLPVLLLAYLIRFLPQAVGTTKNSLSQINPRLKEAGRSLGRGRLKIFKEVILPLLKPGLLAGGALVFLTTMKELPATLLLRPTGFETLATRIWQATEEAFFARAGAHGLILIFATFLVLSLLWGLNVNLRKRGFDF